MSSDDKMPTLELDEAMKAAGMQQLGENITITVKTFDMEPLTDEEDQSVTSLDKEQHGDCGGGGGGGGEPPAKKRASRKKVRTEEDEAERKEKQMAYYQEQKKQRAAYKQALRGNTRVKSNQASLHTEYLPKYVPAPRGNRPMANLDWHNYDKAKVRLEILQPTAQIILMLKQAGVHISETNSGVFEP
jgi:hypothetical protein